MNENKDFFNKEYVFRGKHAQYVKALTTTFGKNENYIMFKRNYDVYLLAPIIGFLNKKVAEIDTSSDETTKIFLEQILKIKEDVKYNYRLIMLNDKKHEPDYEERINKAFKYIGTSEGEKDLELFNKYVLGGVEILYERIIKKVKTSEDYILNLTEFTKEFDDLYNIEKDLEDMF